MKNTVVLLLCLLINVCRPQVCNQRNLGGGKSVCVCNSDNCDTIPALALTGTGQYQIYTTTPDKLGFNSGVAEFNTAQSDISLNIDKSKRFQNILGFGGAFTDSSGFNIQSLPEEAQNKLLNSLFGEDGIEYSLARVPIGGADYSPRPYSYDDHPGDVALEKFELQQEDWKYKIPYIKKALELRKGRPLSLLASAWTAPSWMKTNNDWTGVGVLKEQYYQAWANYYIKFFQNYEENGIKFWGVTTGNEPTDGFLTKKQSQINAMGWTPVTQGKWIRENFGPTLRNSAYKDLKVLAHDDNRFALPRLGLLLQNEENLKYIDGVGTHWYADPILPDLLMKYTKTPKKDLILVSTEACNGFLYAFNLEPAVDLGSWRRGVKYVDHIVKYLGEFNAVGWIDWNIVLNPEGGPLYIHNNVDAVIIANETSGEFYKQPMFYALGHFSKFVVPESTRISAELKSSEKLKNVKTVAFIRPDNLTSIFISNQEQRAVNVEISDGVNKFTVGIAPQSFNTILYK